MDPALHLVEGPGGLPPAASLVGLASLPRMGPRRLRALLAGRAPNAAWALVRSGRVGDLPEVAETLAPDGPGLVVRWARVAARLDPAELWSRHERAGVTVLAEDDRGYPDALAADIEPPAVLFARGALQALDGTRVAIVGTRRCTQYGREIARELGHDLARAGVRVVSGLALGIDGAAHAGALAASAAPPVGVVGNGLDVPYPRRHAPLYRQVAEAGLLLSEHPLGAQPRTWTFPARNRIVAALSHAVVVVECHERGGSLYTVDEADRRDVEVFAVPGSVRSPASTGTNALLHAGRGPVRDATDVLLHLGLSAATLQARPAVEAVPGRSGVAGGDRAGPRVELRPVLDAVGWEEASLEQLLLRTGLGLAELHAALDELESGGWVTWHGSWVERSTTRSGRRTR